MNMLYRFQGTPAGGRGVAACVSFLRLSISISCKFMGVSRPREVLWALIHSQLSDVGIYRAAGGFHNDSRNRLLRPDCVSF